MKIAKFIISIGLIISTVAGISSKGSADTYMDKLTYGQILNVKKQPIGKNVTEQNAKLIKDFYAAFLSGDAEKATSYITNDFIMHVPGKGLNAGDYWYADGLKQFMSNIMSYNGGKFEMQVPNIAFGKDVAFTREIVKFNRKYDPNRIFEQQFIMQYRIKNGKISEAWTIPFDLYTYDEYWTPPATARKNGELSRIKPGLINTVGAYSKKNEQMIMDFYQKFWNGNMDGMKALTHKDFEWYVPGKSELAGLYKGWDGYLQFRDKLVNLAGDKYKLELATIAASDKEAYVEEYIRMNRKWDPVPRVVPAVILHFIFKDGKIIRVNDIPMNLYEYEEFFKAPQ